MNEMGGHHAADHLRELEFELLRPAARRSPERLSELLADGFREFGSSGRVYGRQDIIEALQTEAPTQFSISDFQVEQVNSSVALVTYRSEKQETGGQSQSASLRSSLWVVEAGRWRMLFHQGTKAADRSC